MRAPFPTEGVVREVREETGLEIEVTRLTGVYKNMVRGVVAIMFRAHLTGGTLSTSNETERVEWWTPEDVAQRMDPAYAVRVLDALRETLPPRANPRRRTSHCERLTTSRHTPTSAHSARVAERAGVDRAEAHPTLLMYGIGGVAGLGSAG